MRTLRLFRGANLSPDRYCAPSPRLDISSPSRRCNLTIPRRHFSGRSLDSKPRLRTLAIETSCDDTSVAVLDIISSNSRKTLNTEVLFHDKVTANNADYGGIHPLVALDSHQRQLGQLTQQAMKCVSSVSHHNHAIAHNDGRPDFVSVTRGPGMRSNLSVGLNTAKGLALAWNVPLVGVHHMQAHALTSRLCSTIHVHRHNKETTTTWDPNSLKPRFPFLSLLVSGGHTLLIDSKSLIEHRILAESQDIAVGDYLDKAARAILTPSELKAPYGKALEDFAFATNAPYEYIPPKNRGQELEQRTTSFGWSINPPLSESKGGEKSSRRMVYSFAGLLSSIQRLTRQYDGASEIGVKAQNPLSTEERRELAREVQRVAFEHLASRILLHLEDIGKGSGSRSAIETVVISGGVASNAFLRHVLRSILDARGYSAIELQFPPPELCTDNALMIAWAGMEMYDAGYVSEMSIAPLRRWSLDPAADDGGIHGVGGWKKWHPE